MSNIAVTQSNMPASYQDLMKLLEPETNLTGGAFASTRRLSIRGGVFRKVVNGKEVAELESRTLEVVVVKAAPISRMYYEGTYSAGESNPPVCWSANTQTQKPAGEVPEDGKQSSSCMDCPQNIKGSGQGDSRACRFQQRIAILLADENGKVVSNEPYLLSLPATSIFGDDQKKMSMQAYARHLNAHKTPLASVITELRFDTNSSTPKLFFKPVRPLSEDELQIAVSVQQDKDTIDLVEIKVSTKRDSDGTTNRPALAPLFASESSDDADEEPKVRANKKKTDKPETQDLASLLDEFDDE